MLGRSARASIRRAIDPTIAPILNPGLEVVVRYGIEAGPEGQHDAARVIRPGQADVPLALELLVDDEIEHEVAIHPPDRLEHDPADVERDAELLRQGFRKLDLNALCGASPFLAE